MPAVGMINVRSPRGGVGARTPVHSPRGAARPPRPRRFRTVGDVRAEESLPTPCSTEADRNPRPRAVEAPEPLCAGTPAPEGAGRGRRRRRKSSASRRCCWTCPRSTRSTWRSCRKWTARVRGRGSGGWRSAAWEGGRGAGGPGGRGAAGAHGLLASSVAVVAEFGRIAVEFLRRGSNPKVYEGAARKLSVSSDTVQHGVEGLTYLLTESSKLMISELDFQDSVFVLGFSEELNKLLLQLYLDNRKEIRTILSELSPDLPSYHSLEWRLDVQLASRSLRQQIKPSVTIKLHLNQNGDHNTKVLQTDPATLLHLVQQLEQALEEMKTNHCRRVVRNIK
uniref:COMM domain containing 2 n=1 Tax=Canis lupus familiaris TaxID=9615 RepID=A0A8I3PPV2_CANLF